jgi:hypothetical protein
MTGPGDKTAPDYTARALAAVIEAARTERDFAEWLTHLLAAVAGEMGSSYALIAGRPGSWEAAKLEDLLTSTVGGDDEYLPLPGWRTRAPEFGHIAYGVSIGEQDGYLLIAAGHVDPRRFLAAVNHFGRHELGAFGGDYDPKRVGHIYAAHAPESTPGKWRLELDAPAGRPGSFPVTVLVD